MKFFLSMLALAAVANAATTFSAPTQSNGTTYDAVDVTGFDTMGNDMAGMIITGTFFGGGSAVCNWVAGPGANEGGCTASSGGRGFKLALSGDTFSNPFNLTNIVGASLTSLTFDGPSGNTTFDRTV